MTRTIHVIHRWTSLAFSVAVATIFAGMAITTVPEWFYYLPLPALAVLLPTGLYMFFRPYFGTRRNAAAPHEGQAR